MIQRVKGFVKYFCVTIIAVCYATPSFATNDGDDAIVMTTVSQSVFEKPLIAPATTIKLPAKHNAPGQDIAFAANFDEGMEGWTFTHGEGSVITWELKQNAKVAPYEGDVKSLHADGPYQVYKRTIGTATSPAFSVPADGKLHAKVYLAPVFTDYAVITFSVVANGIETKVWSSATITEGSSQWFDVEADLSAFATQTVTLVITYGPGINDSFNVGGYMADFYIDDIIVDNNESHNPEEETPLTAVMECPATFRYHATGRRMVAPMLPVQFHDRSLGEPTEWTWLLTNGDESQTSGQIIVPTDEYHHDQNPTISYNFMGKQYAVLTVSNAKEETDYCYDELEVAYEGLISNLQTTDKPAVYDMGDDGVFPGTNKGVASTIAERFSRPSRPALITGAYVYCTKAEADELYEQIQSVTFGICRDNDGVPGEMIDFDSWTTTELGYAVATNDGMVTIEFSKPIIIDEDFWFVIDGIPAKTDHIDIRFAMAAMRDNGNTTYMLHNGKWRPMTGYYQAAPGGQTSLYVMPMLRHSVLTFLSADAPASGSAAITVDGNACTVKQQIYSWLGYQYKGSSADWCRVTSTPNGYTLDELTIECDNNPSELASRQAVLTFTDGISTITLEVTQAAATTAISTVTAPNHASTKAYTISGQPLPVIPTAPGIKIINGRKEISK